MKRVLVLSPHPDDETLGCGGTLRKHVEHGDLVAVVFLTSGEQGGHGLSPAETSVVREQEARMAASVLGISDITFYGQPDNSLRATEEVVARLREKLASWRPDVIYVPHVNEMHADHRAAVEVLRGALRPFGTHPEVLMYEVWTPLQRMDEIVDITPYVERKREAIRAYHSQIAVMDFEEAMLGLNRYRGEMHSWPEGDYAEVFARLNLEPVGR